MLPRRQRSPLAALVRDFLISKALRSSRSLTSVIGELTEKEVLHVLQVEFESLRRSVMIEKLILKAGELHRLTYLKSLKEKYQHGT